MAGRSDDPEERLLVSRELGKAKRTIHAVRNLYIATAILTGLVFGIVLLVQIGPIYVVVTGAAFLLALYGIWGVRTEPFLWTLGAAAYWSIAVVNRIVEGHTRSMWFWVICSWAVGCWLLLPTTRRVKELLRKHPELGVSRTMRGLPRRRR